MVLQSSYIVDNCAGQTTGRIWLLFRVAALRWLRLLVLAKAKVLSGEESSRRTHQQITLTLSLRPAGEYGLAIEEILRRIRTM